MFSAWFRALTIANSGQPVVRSGLLADTDNNAEYGDVLQGNFLIETVKV